MKKELKIANLQFDNPFMLAPLAGISDGPFRRLCFEHGASYACSEMVSAKGLYYGDKNTETLLKILSGEGPVGFQIFGHEPEILAWAARELENRDNKILDINMGCPVPKIVKNGEGSALMKNPDLVYDIVYETVKNTKKPVTVKIRAGWDEKTINAVEVAKAATSAGASAICVHGRTREQFYSGKADWTIIKKVREAINSIPVIGNGDVTSWETAKKMFDETGVDFIMIGRGAFGNPWLFSELNACYKAKLDGIDVSSIDELIAIDSSLYQKPTVEDVKAMMIRHLTDLQSEKGDYTAVREMRKHVGWYIKGFKGACKLRGMINQINDVEKLKQAIKNL